jgi:hypothetical protein
MHAEIGMQEMSNGKVSTKVVTSIKPIAPEKKPTPPQA